MKTMSAPSSTSDAIAVVHPPPARPTIGTGARAQALGDIGAELQGGLDRRILQHLRVGVGADEFHAVDVRDSSMC
jgi:hypothetical protein